MVKVRVTITVREGTIRPLISSPPKSIIDKWVALKLRGIVTDEELRNKIAEQVYKEVCAACEGVGQVAPDYYAGAPVRVCSICKGTGVTRQSTPPR
jgi:hypothetical protein